MSNSRLTALDGLRGLAALSVFFSHCAYTLSADQFAIAFGTPLRLFIDGQAAVDLFFVLSGYVLALPYLQGAGPTWATFMIRRAFRLYPAHWVAFGLAWLLSALILQQNLNAWGATHPTPSDGLKVLQQLALLGDRTAMSGVNSVIWTLAIEIEMAFIFPFLARGLMGSAQQQAAILFGSIFVGLFFWPLPLFVFGALLARHRPAIRFALLGGVVLYGIRAFVPSLADIYLGHIICGLGGALLVSIAADGRLHILDRSLPQFLGRVSYSFYLVHLPILLVVVSWLSGVSMLLAWSLSLVLTLGVSSLLVRTTELPGQQMGRRVAARRQLRVLQKAG